VGLVRCALKLALCLPFRAYLGYLSWQEERATRRGGVNQRGEPVPYRESHCCD
jgi:hypothetical protein